MIRGVIFDLDGVLLDSIPYWKGLGETYVRSLGKQPIENMGNILFSMSMEQGAEWLRDSFSLQKTPEQIEQDMEEILRDFYYNEVALKTGASDLLKELCDLGLPLVAATSSPREHVTRALTRNNVIDAFNGIFTNGEVGESKHSPLIYTLAAASLDSIPNTTFVFEDSLYALETAANAGFHTVGILDSSGEPNQEGLKNTAKYYFENPLGFLTQLKEGGIAEFN